MRSLIVVLLVLMVLALVLPLRAEEPMGVEEAARAGGVMTEAPDDGGSAILALVVIVGILALYGWLNQEEDKGSITITETTDIRVRAKRGQKVNMKDITADVLAKRKPAGYKLTEAKPVTSVQWRIDE